MARASLSARAESQIDRLVFAMGRVWIENVGE